MMLKRTSIAIAISLASALALSACNKNAPEQATPAASAPEAPVSAPAQQTPAAEPVTLVSVDLGNAVGPDQKVTTATTTFMPKDTIYASVATAGTGSATLEAKWTYQGGQAVKDDSKAITASGPANTTFSINKPDGWPAGNYKVDISLNGTQVASKDFSVQ